MASFGLESLGGAAMDLFGPKAGKAEAGQARSLRMRGDIYRTEAEGLDRAASMSGDSLRFSELSTRLQLLQQEREAMKVIGGQQADVAGAGFAASGSALDILRDSAAQAALSRGIIGTQGAIDANVYKAAVDTYTTQAATTRATAAIADETAQQYDELADDARSKQQTSGIIKGISGIAELGLSIFSMGL